MIINIHNQNAYVSLTHEAISSFPPTFDDVALGIHVPLAALGHVLAVEGVPPPPGLLLPAVRSLGAPLVVLEEVAVRAGGEAPSGCEGRRAGSLPSDCLCEGGLAWHLESLPQWLVHAKFHAKV